MTDTASSPEDATRWQQSSSQRRGYEWAKAGAALGILAGPAVLATTAVIAFDVQIGAPWLTGLWFVGFGVGPIWAWSILHGYIGFPERVTAHEIGGRTGLRRRGPWRSVCLDRLASVNYHKLFTKWTVTHYFRLSDRDGGRLVVAIEVDLLYARGDAQRMRRDAQRMWLEWLRQRLLKAIDAAPGVRAGSATRRRLAGATRLSDLALTVTVCFAAFVVAAVIMTQMGILE